MKAPRFSVITGVLVALFLLASPVQAASVVTDNFYYMIATGAVDADTDTFYCTLHTSSITPSKAWVYASSLTNEVTGTGYTAAGHACTVTVTVDTTNHRVDINIASHNWTSATITARFQCVRKRRGGALSADELMGCFDFGSDVISTAGTFTAGAISPAARIAN